MNMLLGEKLKKARKNIGMSQNEVAEELMLSRQTISKWENNVCLPDLENFQRICKLYKVDFNTILSKDEGKIIYNIDKSEKEEEDTKEIDIRYRHYLIPFFFLKVLLDKKRRKRVCKKYILLLIGNIAVFLISLAVSVYFAEPIRAAIPINLLLLLILVHIVYVLIRWYVKGCKRSRGYY